MKISCDVTRDILPLYAEDMVSEDTKALVEEHLEDCAPCREVLQTLRDTVRIPVGAQPEALKKVSRAIIRNRLRNVTLAVLVTLSVLGCIAAYFTCPQYLTAEEAVVSVEEVDGIPYLYCNEGVEYFSTYHYGGASRNEDTIQIFCCTNRWSRWFGTKTNRNIPFLGLSSEEERWVYGAENVLLRGSETTEMFIPDWNLLQISLLAALVVAVALTALSALWLLRKHQEGRWLGYVALLPWSYLAVNMIFCGFDLRTYYLFSDHDISVAAVICGVLTLIVYSAVMLVITKRRQDKNI